MLDKRNYHPHNINCHKNVLFAMLENPMFAGYQSPQQIRCRQYVDEIQ